MELAELSNVGCVPSDPRRKPMLATVRVVDSPSEFSSNRNSPIQACKTQPTLKAGPSMLVCSAHNQVVLVVAVPQNHAACFMILT